MEYLISGQQRQWIEYQKKKKEKTVYENIAHTRTQQKTGSVTFQITYSRVDWRQNVHHSHWLKREFRSLYADLNVAFVSKSPNSLSPKLSSWIRVTYSFVYFHNSAAVCICVHIYIYISHRQPLNEWSRDSGQQCHQWNQNYHHNYLLFFRFVEARRRSNGIKRFYPTIE